MKSLLFTGQTFLIFSWETIVFYSAIFTFLFISLGKVVVPHSSALPNLSVIFLERDWIVSHSWESSNILYLVGSSSWLNSISLNVTYIHILNIDIGEVLDFCSLCFGLVVALWINQNVGWIYSWWSSTFVPWLPHQKEQGNGLRKGINSDITHHMRYIYQYFVPVCSG